MFRALLNLFGERKPKTNEERRSSVTSEDQMEDYRERLIETVKRLRKSKKYEFLPPTLEQDVLAFEAKFDVRLPEDYKWFITNIANAVKAVDKSRINLLDGINWADYWFKEGKYNPARPFPLTSRMVGYCKDASEDDTLYPFDSIYDYKATFSYSGYRFGEVSLRGTGCGSDDFLVINGAEYGHVWVDNYSSNSEVYPAFDYSLGEDGKKRLTFTDWFCMCVKHFDRMGMLD